MHAPPTHTTDGQPASPLALAVLYLAERWAETARAQSIYPEGHHRVGAALETWTTALAAARALAPGTSLQLVFTGQGLVAQGLPFETAEGSNLPWLRERLDHAALAGLVIEPAAEATSLEAFHRRLLEVYGRREPVEDVAATWGQGDWPGLRLLDRRFEGVFEGEAQELRTTQRTWAGRGGTGPERTERARLVDMLMGDRALVARLRELSAQLAASEPASAQGQAPPARAKHDARQVLTALAQMLPPAAAQEAAQARTIVGHLVEALEARRGDRLAAPDLAAMLKDPGLERRAAWLCTTLLRPDVAPESAARVRAEAPKGPQGHAGDDGIHDNLDEFLAELARLPAFEADADLRVEAPAESLGVLLHVLLHHEDPARIPSLQSQLATQLHDPDAACLAVLQRVLLAATQRADVDLASQGLGRITDMLRALDRLALLRTCGFLSAERVVASFPAGFGDWLDTLHPEGQDDQLDLQTVLTALGPERLSQHASELASRGGLGSRGVAARLLAQPLPMLAPLARVWLLRGGMEHRTAIAAWLRSLRLPERAAQALAMVDDPSTLPDSLLQGLIDRAEGRPLARATESQAAEAIVRFVRASAGREDRRARRLEALRQLGHFDHPDALAVLQQVVRARRWIVVPVEDRVSRQVAAETLRRKGAA